MTIKMIQVEFLPLVPTDATSNIQPAAAPVAQVDTAARPDCISNIMRNGSWLSDHPASDVPANAIVYR